MEKKEEKLKIGRVIKGYYAFPITIGIVGLLLSIGLFFVDIKAGTISMVVYAVVLLASVIFVNINQRHLVEGLLRLARDYQSLEGVFISGFPIPYAIADVPGDILIYNDLFRKMYDEAPGKKNLCDLFHELKPEDLVFEGSYKDYSIKYNSRNWRMRISKLPVKKELFEERFITLTLSHEYVFSVYLFDETEIVNMVRKGVEEQAVIGSIYIDNYDETLDSSTDVKKSMIIAQVDQTILNYFQNVEGIVRKLEKDRYFVAFKRRYLPVLQRSKFELLDEVKKIETEREIPVTLSIGIGVGAELTRNSENARAALELALGRGGDQAVVRDGERIYYYGGKTRQAEKNSRVKARVKAVALKEIILNHEKVVVMGHKVCDIDCLGAAIGIYRASKALGKKAYIILNELNNTVRPILNYFESDPDYDDVFIYASEAAGYVDTNTALVIVDVNKPDYFECPELVDRTKTIVLIDHHLQSGEKLETISLLHHEPTSSSASEMVSELLQYIDNVKLKKIEAEALYAGILLDTNYFSKNTGVRTFEAAAFLRKNGVDVAKVKELFNDSMEDFKAKAETVRNAEIVEERYAMAVCPTEHIDNPTVVAAQVANELLDVSGIVGSFVLADINGKIYISARSKGDVNVQLAMERLGGGGHMNTAGAQVENSSIEDTKKKLKITIKKMIEEGIL
ncbi:MAG: DHH family phosphoesterase [Parasporobacterium sp.]|nr:DHH family phosphoesterase [Parasporobacterium sp.]